MSRVTICVATKDRRSQLHQLIWSLRNQTFKDWDLIIVDDSQGDFSQEAWTKDQLYARLIAELQLQKHKVKIIPGPKSGNVGAVYQLGWTISRNDWKNPLFYRADDDTWLERDYLEKLQSVFSDPTIGAAAGLMLTPGKKQEVIDELDHRYEWGTVDHLNSGFNLQWVRHKKTTPFPVEHLNSNQMFRDDILERINGFEPKLYSWFREETQCSWRVHVEGLKVVVHPLAEAWHLRADSGGTRPLGNKALDDARAFSLQRKSMKPGIHISLTHAIGDLVMAVPAIEGLKKKFPDRNLVVYHPFAKDVFINNPNVDYIAKTYNDEHRTCRIEKSIYSWMAENKWGGHMVEAYCKMLDVDFPEDITPKLYGIEPYVQDKGYAILAPQSNAKIYDFSDISRTKYWPVDRWNEIIEFVKSEYGLDVIHLTGEEVHDTFNGVTQVNNLNFRDAWARIAGAKLVLSIDTMAAHIAAALDIPAVVLWGRTSPSVYGYDKDNIVNLHNKCPEDSPCFGGVAWQQDKKQCPLAGHPCMDNTSVSMVKSAIRRLLKG